MIFKVKSYGFWPMTFFCGKTRNLPIDLRGNITLDKGAFTMEQNNTFMKTRPIFPLLMSMSIPMMLSMLIQSLYNIVDSIYVSILGTDALTAVSLAYPLRHLHPSGCRKSGKGQPFGHHRSGFSFLPLSAVFAGWHFRHETVPEAVHQRRADSGRCL